MDAWSGPTTPTPDLIAMASERIAREALDPGKHSGDEVAKLQRGSVRARLVRDVMSAASSFSLSNGYDVYAFEDLAYRGIAIVDGLQYGLTEHQSSDAFGKEQKRPLNWNFWYHVENAPGRIKSRTFPYIDRFSIEEDAYSYLDLPYRVPLLERTIVDILIALEMFAFSKEMFEKPIPGFAWANKSPLMQKHALVQYLSGQFWGGVIFLGLAYLSAKYGEPVLGNSGTGWAVSIFATLFCINFFLSTALLPFVWRHQSKKRREVRKLIVLMLETYHELHGGGQLSTRRLREVAARAADAGVVWPKPLFLILDDNERRLGRI